MASEITHAEIFVRFMDGEVPDIFRINANDFKDKSRFIAVVDSIVDGLKRYGGFQAQVTIHGTITEPYNPPRTKPSDVADAIEREFRRTSPTQK